MGKNVNIAFIHKEIDMCTFTYEVAQMLEDYDKNKFRELRDRIDMLEKKVELLEDELALNHLNKYLAGRNNEKCTDD